MLHVENLTLKYGQSQILHEITMSAQLGRVTCVMGNNGMGKTSLLKAIAGRHPYVDGSISLDGTILDHVSAFRAARAGIGEILGLPPEHWAVLGVLTNCSWSVLVENVSPFGPRWRLQEYNAGTLPESALADDR